MKRNQKIILLIAIFFMGLLSSCYVEVDEHGHHHHYWHHHHDAVVVGVHAYNTDSIQQQNIAQR